MQRQRTPWPLSLPSSLSLLLPLMAMQSPARTEPAKPLGWQAEVS